MFPRANVLKKEHYSEQPTKKEERFPPSTFEENERTVCEVFVSQLCRAMFVQRAKLLEAYSPENCIPYSFVVPFAY